MSAPGFQVKPTQLQVFMYKDEVIDPNDLDKGLFQNLILKNVSATVFSVEFELQY